jgi:hypothetical protein
MPVNPRRQFGDRTKPPTKSESPYLGHSSNMTDPTTGESLFNSPNTVIRQARGLNSKEVQAMANAHYVAQMANAGHKYKSSGRNYNVNDDPQVGNTTYAELNYLGGPTGNPGPRSNGTLYAEVSHTPSGVRGRYESGAVKYKSRTKPVGGARKKTRKNKKESRESKKLRKSRKSRK